MSMCLLILVNVEFTTSINCGVLREDFDYNMANPTSNR